MRSFKNNTTDRQVLLVQIQVGDLVVSAPPMFLSAVKETDEEVESKRRKMDEAPVPAVELQALVPLETTVKKRQQQQQRQLVAQQDGEQVQALVPDLRFESAKSERVKTRHMLLALNQSLQKMLGFRFSDTLPEIQLRPQRLSEERIVYKNSRGEKMVYFFNKDTYETTWQSTRTACFQKHLRLASVMDEGSSSYSLFAALADSCAVLPLRDSMHKLTRVQELAFSGDEVLKSLRREIFLCLKLDRAPYSTSRFGRRLKEAAAMYAESMEESDQLLSPFLAAIAKDLGLPTIDFDQIKSGILDFAKKTEKGMTNDYQQGRWDSLFDGSTVLLRLKLSCWFKVFSWSRSKCFGNCMLLLKTTILTTSHMARQWHIRLFAILAAALLEGDNPWNFVAKSVHDPAAEKWAIIPSVARVPCLSIWSMLATGNIPTHGTYKWLHMEISQITISTYFYKMQAVSGNVIHIVRSI